MITLALLLALLGASLYGNTLVAGKLLNRPTHVRFTVAADACYVNPKARAMDSH